MAPRLHNEDANAPQDAAGEFTLMLRHGILFRLNEFGRRGVHRAFTY